MFYGYARVSTEEQHDTSLQVQLDFLERQSLILKEDFIPMQEKASGKDTNRPVFSNLLNILKPGDILGVYDNSRLGRNTQENLQVFSQLSTKGVRLHCSGRFIDMTSPQEKMLFSVESAFSTFQRDIQLDKSRKGIDATKANGDWIMRGDLLGWTLTKTRGKTTATIDPQAAQIIQEIFKRYSNGESIFTLAKDYENRKLLNTNYSFTASNIRRILLKPIYMGYYTRETLDYTKIHKISKASLLGMLVKSNIYPPIVSEELWWDVFDKWRTLKRTHTRQFDYRYSFYETTGIYRCPECGAGYVHSFCKRGNKVIEYFNCHHNSRCPNPENRNIPKNVAETLMRLSFFITFENGAEVGYFFQDDREKAEKQLEESAFQAKALQEKIDTISSRLGNLIDAVADGLLSKDDIKSKVASLNEDKKAYEKELNRLKKEMEICQLDVEDLVMESSQDIMERFIHFPDLRREIYLKYLDEACVYKDKIVIKYLNGKWFEFYLNPKRSRNTYGKITFSYGHNKTLQMTGGKLEGILLYYEYEVNKKMNNLFELKVHKYYKQILDKAEKFLQECENV